MKKALILAALLALVAGTTASATVTVWFELVGVTDGGQPDPLGSPGGPGASLDLLCDPALNGRCDWIINIVATNDTAGQASWGLSLGTHPSDTASQGKLQLKQYIPGTEDPFPLEGATTLNGPGGLLIDTGANVNPALPAGYPPVVLGQIHLSKHKLSPLDTNSVDIFAAIGTNEFGGDDAGFYEVVAVGPNAPVPGNFSGLPWQYNGYGYYPDYILPGAVIKIRNVPEPATFGALGLGLLCLLRRRK